MTISRRERERRVVDGPRHGQTGSLTGKAARKWIWSGAAIILLALAGGHRIIWAQAPALPAAAVASAADADLRAVRLLVGRSTVVDVGGAITRVSLTSADVADAIVTSPSQLLINGKTPGTISMFVWDRGGALRRFEVVVQRDLARLSEQMVSLFPGEQIDVQSNGRHIVLTGTVTSKDVITRAIDVAAGYVEKREEVTALLQLQAGAPSNQVLLRVRFAEVSRTAMTDLGVSFFTSPLGVENTLGRVTTQQYAAPGFENLEWTKESSEFGAPVTSASGQFAFSDFLNLFLFSQKYDLGTMIKALQVKGLFQSLAEPNLIAESGKEASFLAGGEFPIPVAQGSGANIGVSVMFKEFGIRLTFTPTVTGDRVHLKVKPEVSALDFNNSVVLGGFRIPALTTRRTETELELQDGQTFAIAGLMNNTMRTSLSKVPGIGDIPILGLLFKSKAAQKEQTELVVMITPQILPNNSPGVTRELPRTPDTFLPRLPDNRTREMPPPAYGAPGPGAAAQPAAPAPVTAVVPAPAAPPAAPRVGRPTTPAPVAPAAARPPTPDELKAMERARRLEGEQAARDARIAAEADRRAKEAEGRRLAEQAIRDRKQAEEDRRAAVKQAEIDRKAAEMEARRQEQLAQEQAKRDAEDAKRQAEADRRQAEADRRQAEADRERQRKIDEAAAKLRAAESAYQAEVEKQAQP